METLEEVAESYVDSFEYGIAHPRRVCKNAFINGAKWQQERSYSEEEVLHILDTFWDRLDVWYNEGVDTEFTLKEWFNKCELKKK